MQSSGAEGSGLAPAAVQHPVQLLAEGKDAKNWFEALVRHISLPDIQVQNYGGVRELRKFLKSFALMPGFQTVRSVGIVRDAEKQGPEDAFRSVRDGLAAAGLPVPSSGGAATHHGTPSVAVLILPGSGRTGMLESLLMESLAEDPVRPCIEDFLVCSESRSRTPTQRPEKSFVHAYLATRPDPHVSVGVAAQKGYWNLDHPAFEKTRRFLSDVHGAVAG